MLNGEIIGIIKFASDRTVMMQLDDSSPRLGSYIWFTIVELTRISRPEKIYRMQHVINMAGKNWWIK